MQPAPERSHRDGRDRRPASSRPTLKITIYGWNIRDIATFDVRVTLLEYLRAIVPGAQPVLAARNREPA